MECGNDRSAVREMQNAEIGESPRAGERVSESERACQTMTFCSRCPVQGDTGKLQGTSGDSENRLKDSFDIHLRCLRETIQWSGVIECAKMFPTRQREKVPGARTPGEGSRWHQRTARVKQVQGSGHPLSNPAAQEETQVLTSNSYSGGRGLNRNLFRLRRAYAKRLRACALLTRKPVQKVYGLPPKQGASSEVLCVSSA